MRRISVFTRAASSIHVPWQTATYDTDGFWDAGNPTRFSIPTGITKIRLMGSLALQASTVSGSVFLSFEKNGAGDVIGCVVATFRQGSTGFTNNDFATFTAVLPVIAGD